MLDGVFASVWENGTASMTTGGLLGCTACSLILGMVIAGIYMFRSEYTKSFVLALSVLPTIVQVVILMVNGNLGAGVAVAGTFSLVRFRSAPGTAKEIVSIFLSMAVGLATGMGYLGVAVFFVLVVDGMELLFAGTHFGEAPKAARILKITIPESLDYTEVFDDDDLFEKYLNSWELQQVKTTNMGSLFKLEYRVVMKEEKEEKKLMDDLRCRNGNLEIFCGKPMVGREEL